MQLNIFANTISVSLLLLFPQFIVFCSICQFCNCLVAVSTTWLIIKIRNVDIGYCTRVTIVVRTFTHLFVIWIQNHHLKFICWLLFFVLFLLLIGRSRNFHSEVIYLVIQVVFIIIQDKMHCFILICLIPSQMRFSVGQLQLNLPLNVEFGCYYYH